VSGAGAGLNQDEVDALTAAIQDGRAAADPGFGRGAPAVAYDLTSQDRIIRGQMPTLDAIHESIASVLGTGLAGRTRLQIRVSAAPTTLLKFVDFNGLLGNAGAICVLSLGPGFGLSLCLLEPGLAEALLSAALGDRKPRAGAPGDARRELTNVEQLVLRRLLSILTDAMALHWAPVMALKPQVLRFETDPRLAVIAPPSELAVITSFEITGAVNGRLQLALPYATLEPVKARLAAPAQLPRGGDERFRHLLENEVANVDVELRSVLGTTSLTFSKLLELQVGDVLTLGTDEDAELPILIQGRPKMTGTPRVVGGSLAVVIARDLSTMAEDARQQHRRFDGNAA